MATIIKTKSKKVLLISDDRVSIAAAQAGLSLSMFGRLRKQLPDIVVLLRRQYRMHLKIFAFVDDNVYGGLLLSNSAPTDFVLQPNTFLDLPNSLDSRNGISFQNEAEYGKRKIDGSKRFGYPKNIFFVGGNFLANFYHPQTEFVSQGMSRIVRNL